jgi:transposase
MYLRTTKRTNLDGSEVTYYQLAHNYRDPETKAIKAKIIHNFGRVDELDRQDLVRLCKSIAKVCGIEITDPLEDRLGTKKRAPRRALPSDIKVIQTHSLGVVLLAEALWERFDIGPTLRDISRENHYRVKYERALFAMMANRLCEPESKLGVWDRWLDRVYLPSCQGLKLAQMYEAMDVLHDNASRVEEAVFFKTADLLNLEVDVIFYDTTSVSFSVDYTDDGDEGLRQYGRGKEGVWAPQVVVALAVTREGIPVRSWVFPGNTSDVETVKQVKKDLRGWKLGRALFVGDSGMNSEKNREMLARACGTYLLAVRAGSVKEVQQKVLNRPGRYHQISENLKAKEVVLGKGVKRRRYILCLNEAEARRQLKHREQVLKELDKEIASHETNSATAKWAIKLQASGRYGRYLKERRGKVVINTAAIRKAERMDGKWVVTTNDDTLSFEDAATGYKNLMVIERCFRSLKRTRIQMSPMYHWLPKRIEAHVKICVLALLIERVAELATGLPWPRIRHELERLQVTEYRTKTHQFFERNELPTGASEILKKLTIPPPKTVIDISNKP